MDKKNYYLTTKNILRASAIEFQQSITNYSLGELIEIHNYFTTQGKKYGLLKEFRENGVI